MSIRSRLQDFLASRLTPAITPDAEPAEFPPSEGVEPFAVPRWAQPAPVVSIGELERDYNGYAFRLVAPIQIIDLLNHEQCINGLYGDADAHCWVISISSDWSELPAHAVIAYKHLCAVIRAAVAERESQEDAQ